MTEQRLRDLLRQGVIAYYCSDDRHYYVTTAVQQDVKVARR